MVVNNGLAIDYTFAFDASGATATDTLNLECGSGSGHEWALGWTFCDAINLFGGQGTVNSVSNAMVQSIALWPNPASDALRVAGLSVGADVVVMDMAGSRVWEGAVTAGQLTIPTEAMQAGAYILCWTAEGVTGRQRFIVQ